MKNTLAKILDEAQSKNLPFLLIGGNAMILHGFARNTIDLDFLVPEPSRQPWSEMLTSLGFDCFHMTSAFAQFSGGPKWVPVDLLFVNGNTWAKLFAGAVKIQVMSYEIQIPCAEHLVALKLHAASNPTRSKPEADWEDIRYLVTHHSLDVNNASFQQLVHRYGGDAAIERIKSFKNEKPDPYFRPPGAT